MRIFDGYSLAHQKEIRLKKEIDALLSRGITLKIAAILFAEDAGSRLYTQLKKEAAKRVGMEYEVFEFSVLESVETLQAQISQLNLDSTVTGIIIQKPWRKTWTAAIQGRGESAESSDFDQWWLSLVTGIDQKKDVDGLHPKSLESIQNGNWQKLGGVMPATARAVLEILKQIPPETDGQKNSSFLDFLQRLKITIIGKSDLLGRPLFFELKNLQCNVEMIGSRELNEKNEHGNSLRDSDLIISATGRSKLVTGDMVKEGVMLIDVGEPKPDIDFLSVLPKASFLTPVPGGVGPMTVVCLLENCVALATPQPVT